MPICKFGPEILSAARKQRRRSGRGTRLAFGSGETDAPEVHLYILATLTLLLSAADHWTTYLCLRAPVAGWHVAEANPLADWLFSSFGLVPGLMIDSAVTLMAVAFLLSTPRIPNLTKVLFFGAVIAGTSVAVYNNVLAIHALGLSPLGSA
jgi:uncharacterized protein DUF5658